MFVVQPSNIDYLIKDVRLHIGDLEGKRFSDSIVRSALIGGVKMLQRRWSNRYLVYVEGMQAEPPNDVIVPSGSVYALLPEGFAFIPDNLADQDVFRNPFQAFVDSGSSPVSQEDEFPVILSASVILRKSHLTSSSDTFQSWSDGEFTFSNLGSQRSFGSLYEQDLAALEAYFKKRLSPPLRSTFGTV